MTMQFTTPDQSGRDDHTQIVPHLMPQRICFVDEQGQEKAFAHFPLLIGRSPENGWVIPNKNISRHHAEIQFFAEQYTLQDLHSLNGVRVNGFKIDRVVLEEGDRVSFADFNFVFHIRKAIEASYQKPMPTFSIPASTAPIAAMPVEEPSPVVASSPSVQPAAFVPSNLEQELDELDFDESFTDENELLTSSSATLKSQPSVTAESMAMMDELEDIEKAKNSRKWWPAVIAVLAAATVATALVAVAYYFLQPQLQPAVPAQKTKSVQQLMAPPVAMKPTPSMPVSSAMTESNVSQMGVMTQPVAAPMPVSSEKMMPLEKAAPSVKTAISEQNVMPAEKMMAPITDKKTTLPQTVTAVSAALPAMTNTQLDLPTSVRQTLTQTSQLTRKTQKKHLVSNDNLVVSVRNLYMQGDEVNLKSVLVQIAQQIEVSHGQRLDLLKLHKTVTHLLDIYHQADQQYQSGNKSQAFGLWAQFLSEERSWLGQQHSVYYQKVTQSVVNEYLARAQTAAASGDAAASARYQQKAQVLSAEIVSVKVPPVKTTVVPSATSNVSSNTVSSSSAAKDAEALYQRGLRLEYSDLDQAIGFWRQAVQLAPAQSDIAAKASAKLNWYDKWKTSQPNQ